MNKLIILLLSLLIILCSCSPLPFTSSIHQSNTTVEEGFYINIEFQLLSGKEVGSDWLKEYTIDGKKIKSGDRLEAERGQELVVDIYIVEQDTHPDFARDRIVITVDDGAIAEKRLLVVEDRGRYAGITANINIVNTIEEK